MTTKKLKSSKYLFTDFLLPLAALFIGDEHVLPVFGEAVLRGNIGPPPELRIIAEPWRRIQRTRPVVWWVRPARHRRRLVVRIVTIS